MKSAELKKSLLLYAVTDRAWLGKNFCCETLSDAVLQAIEGGATLIQLREKELSEKEFLEEAFSIKKICTSKKIPLIINDNVKIAKETDAYGVHIGQSDMELIEARKILGADKIIGVSCQTVEQALQAEKNGADYLGVGAIFSTSTKTEKDISLPSAGQVSGLRAYPNQRAKPLSTLNRNISMLTFFPAKPCVHRLFQSVFTKTKTRLRASIFSESGLTTAFIPKT